ncbi:acetylornithine deacetylase-like [Cucumis melo var. makuwa]|uniref:Acetylornithine deacetylase n=1 Tax=Cucumis melo var. makuwa TaxID=1194695 RepID=A0A5A7T6W0_CUCMM|nr:acetylornithine deacetylase-like [Cucumis melo var. makuwa]
MSSSIQDILGELQKDSYISLLSKLIGESEFVQNNPPDLIPQEDRVGKHVLDVLNPYNNVLKIKRVSYDEKDERGHLIIEYPGTVPGKVVSFVGSHMDVVPANPDEWDLFYPFSLSIDGDKLQGRGTTDCLGHVALLTQLMLKLAQTKPKLKSSVVVIFIVSEENNSIPGIGVERLYAEGYFKNLKGGPLYWVDTADSQPCIGTGGSLTWTINTTGKLFHSGMPDKAINALELAMDALKSIQLKFYEDFPAVVPQEADYGFSIPSTMKPTQWSYPEGAINQIPEKCTIAGDVSMDYLKNKLGEYIDYTNAHVEDLASRGPVSKYVLPDGTRGELAIIFGDPLPGIACDLKSLGFKVLYNATKQVIGEVKPYSLTGSLPLVYDLQV